MKVSMSMLKAIWLAVLLLLVFSGTLFSPYLLIPTVAVIWAAPLLHGMLPLKGQPDERQLYIAQSSGTKQEFRHKPSLNQVIYFFFA